MRGLDGLRAVAVLLVILFHQELLLNGWIGVQIFFVLSGYLITGLLIADRHAPLRSYLRSFFGRRMLRIFPLYYAYIAALAVAALFGLSPGISAGLPFAATYTYNLWHASSAFRFSEALTHFWSLCVEEQFYLVWPLLLYFCPPKALRVVLLGLVVLGPALRWITFVALNQPGVPALGDRHIGLYVLTVSHLDAFAIGGYAAAFQLRSSAYRVLAASALVVMAGVIVKFLFGPMRWLTFGYPLGLRPGFAFLWGYTLLNLLAALLIRAIAARALCPRFFEWRPLRYVGEISYGVYILHYPIQGLLEYLLPGVHVLVRLAGQLLLTLLSASLSYRFLESPFLRMKEKLFARPSVGI